MGETTAFESGAVPTDGAWWPQGLLCKRQETADPAAHLPCLRLGWLNPQQLLFGNYFSRSLPEDTASCPDNVLGLQSGLELEVTAGRGRELSQSWGRP